MSVPYGDTTAKNRGAAQSLTRVATRIAVGLICVVAAAGLSAPNASAQDTKTDQAAPKLTSEMCLGCHGLEGFAPPATPGVKQFPMVLKDRFLGSVHGKLQLRRVPHQHHQDSARQGHVQGELRHLPREPAGRRRKENNKTDEIAKLTGVVEMIDRYMKSIHAQPSKVDQSHTNATCYNCHDAHYVYPKGTPNRNWWRLNLPYACGACHTAELAEYKTSVHGQEVLAGTAIRRRRSARTATPRTTFRTPSSTRPSS